MMSLNGCKSESMVLPSCQILGAVYPHTSTLGVPLDLVLSKKPELLGRIIVVDSAGMCVD